MMYIISTGCYRCPDYREMTYVSEKWLRKRLMQLDYPYSTLFNGADWNCYDKHYKLQIWFDL